MARAWLPRRIGSGMVLVGLLVGCDREAPSVAAGRDLFRQSGCTGCHGPEGRGDGPVARTLTVPPGDLRTIAFRQGHDVDAIAETIRTGIVLHLGEGSGSNALHYENQVMPRFDHLSLQERQSIALYLTALRTAAERERSHP